ncbi:MAG: SDR family oxidoreductase [Planctomycetaceae bacterium]|nr:SDR family oxidoreductase [Planctomycetaceae bacterium]
MEMFNLAGNVAIVAGAASGIGQAMAIGLAEAGADVACFDLAGAPDMGTTVKGVEKFGRRALVVDGDVTNEKDLARLVQVTEKDLGALTLAVNCAGIANAEAAEKMPREQWQKMIDVDLTGIFLTCQAEARVMLPRGAGSIVNIASMSGVIVNRGLLQCHYNCAKAGVIHLTKSMAMEWASRGIRVNSISPGYTWSPMNKRPEVAEQVEQFARETPMGRLAEPEEMVGPAVFLLSKAASFCTGHDLVVDGGFVCW